MNQITVQRLARASRGFKLDIHADQRLGRRKRQEDVALAVDIRDVTLLALADGMGGHAAGDEAAQIAAETVHHHLAATEAQTAEDWCRALCAAVTAANESVLAFQATVDAQRKPGSTIVAVLVMPRTGIWAYAAVGDSYIYRRLPGGPLELINELHQNEAGALLSCVGCRPMKMDGAGQIRLLHEGEMLVLASDGIDVLADDERSEILQGDAPVSDLANRLLLAVEAKAHPEQDNTTILVARAYRRAKRTRSSRSVAVGQKRGAR